MNSFVLKDGTLNAFQPVKGGFKFIGDEEDAKRWISHNIAICVELEKKYSALEMMKRLFHFVIDIEMIEDLYRAYMNVKEALEKDKR